MPKLFGIIISFDDYSLKSSDTNVSQEHCLADYIYFLDYNAKGLTEEREHKLDQLADHIGSLL